MKRIFDFSAADQEKVEAAIREVEQECSGEIVVYIAKRSDRYFEACWKLTAITALCELLFIATLSYYWLLPDWVSPLGLSLFVVISSILSGIALLVLPVARLSLIQNSTIAHRVLSKARDMFLQEQLFETRDRTGILLYISQLERRVQVLGDSGINKKINPKEWDYIVGQIINGIKNEKVAEGLCSAVHSCKRLLLDNGFNVRADDTDELSNHIRIEK